MPSDDAADDDGATESEESRRSAVRSDGSSAVADADRTWGEVVGRAASPEEDGTSSDDAPSTDVSLDGDPSADGRNATRPESDRTGGAGPQSPDAEPETGLPYDLDTYRQLLGRLVAADYDFVGFHGSIGPGEVALRHDVDLSVERAVQMARVEAQLGVTSTYCFLITAPVYDLLQPENRRRLASIVEAGHDVGLHFDTHQYWDAAPDPGELADRVAAERESLARVADAAVDAVSFHVPPSWVLGTEFEGFVSTYEPRYFEDVTYASDSSQKWCRERPFPDGLPRSLQLLVHPGLWHEHHRPMADIVDERRRRCVRRIEEYVAPLGE